MILNALAAQPARAAREHRPAVSRILFASNGLSVDITGTRR